MQINELVAVLEHIDTSIHDTELLPTYKTLATALAALAQGERAPLATVQPARTRLVTILSTCEPVGWTPAQMAIFESYGGRALLGEPVAAQIDGAFVEYFMDPSALHAFVDDLRLRTRQLAETVGELLAGLSPVLAEIAAGRAPVLTGDVVDAGEGVALRALQRAGGAGETGGVWDALRARLHLPARRGGTLVATDGATLATRVVAAAPVILAAAAKALELYRDYHERRAVAPSRAPVAAVQPVAQPAAPPAAPPTASYVRYTYRQSVYIFTQDE